MASHAQLPVELWLSPIDGLSESDAAALETAVLAIRMVYRSLKNPDLGVSEAAYESPLVHFAISCDDDGKGKDETLTPAEMLKLQANIDKAYHGSKWSFAMLMDGEPTTRGLWDHPKLNLFTLYRRSHKDAPWALAKTTGSTGKASEVHWQGLEPLAAVLESMFNTKGSPDTDVQYFVSANFPPVIRVKLDAVAGSQQSFQTLRHIQFPAKFIGFDGETNKLRLMRRPTCYALVGAIRHRPDLHSPDLVRLYNRAGLYIPPSLSFDEEKYVPRPYVSDNWEIGTPGYIYTLLYARANPLPVEDAECQVDEFILESIVEEDEEVAAFFREAEGDLRRPHHRSRRAGALDVPDVPEVNMPDIQAEEQDGGGVPMMGMGLEDILRQLTGR